MNTKINIALLAFSLISSVSTHSLSTRKSIQKQLESIEKDEQCIDGILKKRLDNNQKATGRLEVFNKQPGLMADIEEQIFSPEEKEDGKTLERKLLEKCVEEDDVFEQGIRVKILLQTRKNLLFKELKELEERRELKKTKKRFIRKNERLKERLGEQDKVIKEEENEHEEEQKLLQVKLKELKKLGENQL